jgi:hypothetical protein
MAKASNNTPDQTMLGVGRKADDLAVWKSYCCEIQRNEIEIV